MPARGAVRTGCRVDLGGGTFDIWPLGLLHPRSVTTNVCLTTDVRVSMHWRESGFHVKQGESAVAVVGREELGVHPESALVGVVADFFDLPPFEVEIESASPRGGGLGASSAITMALIVLAERLGNRPLASIHDRVRLARDLEARLMGLPTGTQDFFPPLLGGALALRYPPGGAEVGQLAVDLDAFAESLLVVYTGVSHLSAANNWQIVRRRLDGDSEAVRHLKALEEVSALMPSVFEDGDLPALGRLMNDEWSARRNLAEGITTPEIEALLGAAERLGAWGGKACGAGGGGCVALLCPPDRRAEVGEALVALGGVILDTAPRERGLELEVELPH